MNYKLGLREISESDLNAECPWMPEKENYPTYVLAFIEDINHLEIVENAYKLNSAVIIQLVDGATIEQLALESKPIHQHYWSKLRTTGFESIV